MIRLIQNQDELKKLILRWLCCLDYLVYFVKISVWDTLLLFNDDPGKSNASSHSPKQLEKLKLSPSTKSATADKFIITKKKPQEAVSNVDITVIKQMKIKTVRSNVPSINYPYFAKIFKFFVVKFKLIRKSSAEWLFASGCN